MKVKCSGCKLMVNWDEIIPYNNNGDILLLCIDCNDKVKKK
jgi:hypothetical protein